jgi:L-lactate dehydrogenase complex protein LldF
MAIDEPGSRWSRTLLRAWAWLALHPRVYRPVASLVSRTLAIAGRARGSLRALPFGGRWTRYRDLPAPQGQTFQGLYKRRAREVAP